MRRLSIGPLSQSGHLIRRGTYHMTRGREITCWAALLSSSTQLNRTRRGVRPPPQREGQEHVICHPSRGWVVRRDLLQLVADALEPRGWK
jgi:hypothetical protein